MKHAIPDDWDGESFCRFAICWPDSPVWRALLRGLVTEPARGFFWDEKTGSIIGVLGQFRQTMDYNLELREVIMACGDTGLQEIALALRTIAIAMQQQVTVNAGCCGSNSGSGGTGQISPPYNPTPEGDPSTDPPPEGFESWEEFLHDKCAIAYDIVETLEADLGKMALVSSVGLPIEVIAAAVAVIISTPIPFDDLLIIVAFLLNAGWVLVVTSALDIVNQNEQDLVCELFNGESASNSRDRFLSRFNQLVDQGAINPVTNFAVKQLMAYMVGSSVTNRLYTKDNTRNWTTRDCSSCEIELTLRFQDAAGEWQIIPNFQWGEEYSFTAPIQPNGFRYLNFRCYPEYQFPNWEGSYVDVSVINASDTGHCSNSQTYSPGTYGPISNDGSTVNFNFGCSDTSPMTITARFYLPEELMPGP